MRACEQCGKQLGARKRADAKYCSTRCRVQSHRQSGLQTLKQQDRWVNHNEKKHPINPRTGRYARSNDPATWGTYEQARKNRLPLGFMLGNGIGCIDLDHCINPDGTLTYGAQKIVDHYPHNWIEISPSGTGLHIWGTAPERAGFKREWHGQSIEFYSKSRFITITGRTWQAGQLLPL